MRYKKRFKSQIEAHSSYALTRHYKSAFTSFDYLGFDLVLFSD